MAQPITLESVASAFSYWRNSRASNNEAVPDALRDQAVELLICHKKSHVISALKINHSTLKKWQRNSQGEKSAFVALTAESPEMPGTLTLPVSPAPNSAELPPFSGLKITLRSVTGTEMCITGEVTPAQLQSLTDTFIGFQGRKS